MIYVLVLLSCFGIFGRRHRQPAPAARRAPVEGVDNGHYVWVGGPEGYWKWEWTTYKWVETPHWQDGYWKKSDFSGFVDYLWENQQHTPNDEAYWKAIYRKRIEGYPLEPWVWDWPGRNKTDITWHVEVPKDSDKPPENPKRWIRQESYNSLWPGQRGNL